MRSDAHAISDLMDLPDGPSPMRRPAFVVIRARDDIEAFGEQRSLREWAHLTGICQTVLRARLRVLPPEVALSLPKWSHVDLDARPGERKAWNWELLDYEDDPWAQDFVVRHPAGATLEQVGEALGIVKERVSQLEESALQKLQNSGAADWLRRRVG